MQDRFQLLLRVRYSECDAQKVVFNARYADYVDIAATEFFRAVFGSYQNMIDSGVDTQVVRMLVEWKASAKFDDILTIGVKTSHLGGTSFALQVEMRDYYTDQLIAVAENVYVMVTAKTHEKISIPETMRQKLDHGAPGVVYNQAGIPFGGNKRVDN